MVVSCFNNIINGIEAVKKLKLSLKHGNYKLIENLLS